MKSRYLHLSVYPCDQCAGPVVAGSIGERVNEISQETNVHAVGAICLSCGLRQNPAANHDATRSFPPMLWEQAPAPVKDEGKPELVEVR